MPKTAKYPERYVEHVGIKYECVLCHRTFLTSYLKTATRCPWCERLSLKQVEKKDEKGIKIVAKVFQDLYRPLTLLESKHETLVPHLPNPSVGPTLAYLAT